MKPYAALVSARIRMLLQYRAAALAGFCTQLFWGLIRVMIFAGFYASTTAAQPMTLEEVVTYIWLGQALLALLPWNVDAESREMMRSGAVAYELLRPVDLYVFWYSRTIATRVAPTVLRAIPMFLVAGLFLGLSAPASWASGLAWAATMAGAVLLGCAITTLLIIGMLWTVSGEGLYYLMATSVVILSGMLIPLPLFPDWAQPVLNALPFRGLADVPFRVYMGHIPPGEVLGVLAHQLLWTAALIGLGRAVLARGLRRVVVQGG